MIFIYHNMFDQLRIHSHTPYYYVHALKYQDKEELELYQIHVKHHNTVSWVEVAGLFMQH